MNVYKVNLKVMPLPQRRGREASSIKNTKYEFMN
jgi:hypothetical protein